MKNVAWKKPKDWLESSGCEIQRWIEKGFVGFVCFGHKKVKLYIIAPQIIIIAFLYSKIRYLCPEKFGLTNNYRITKIRRFHSHSALIHAASNDLRNAKV